MEKDKKYFTPEIEDIRVGYEYEIENDPVRGIWDKEIIENLYDLENFCKYNKKDNDAEIRTQYLTKEQIEEEGWKQAKCSNPEILSFTKDKYWHCWYTSGGNVLSIDKGTRPLLPNQYFRGYCPSINEFRQIMKLLGI